jgi:hypothetical protein
MLRAIRWPLQFVLAIAISVTLAFIFTSSSITPNCAMSDDDEIQSQLTNGGPSFFAMNEAFYARMLAAIEAGLENAPIGVVTTPGTKSSKCVPAEPLPLVSPQRDMEHA